jgi:hypothetical protein
MKQIAIVTTAAVVMLALCSGPAFAADQDDAAAQAKIMTVFINGKGQSSYADKINETHAAMTAKGWKFAALAMYTEDGDMKGTFVTYTRD